MRVSRLRPASTSTRSCSMIRSAPVPDEQFEFCMGLLEADGRPETLRRRPMRWPCARDLAEFFNAYRILLRNQQERAPVPPITLLANILEMELHQPELASAFELWTVGRRGELFNTGRDTLKSARYCYFDLRDLEGEPELMTAIVYVIFSKVYRDIADERLRSVEKRFVLDEAHRYITDQAFSHWISLIARTGRHWNIMLDLITQSLGDLDDPDQPWSKGHHHQSQAGLLLPGPEGRGSIVSQAADDRLPHRAVQEARSVAVRGPLLVRWRPAPHPPAGGRSVYLLAGHDRRPGTNVKRLMKQLHDGNVRHAIEDLVRLTGHCRNTDERLAILEPYLEERWPSDSTAVEELTRPAPRFERKDETMKRLLFSATLLVLLIPCQAHAFIFTDLVAKAQRITMIAQAAEHLEQYRRLPEGVRQVQEGIRQVLPQFPARLPPAVLRRLGRLHPVQVGAGSRTTSSPSGRPSMKPAWQTQVLALRISSPLSAAIPSIESTRINSWSSPKTRWRSSKGKRLT